MENSGGKIWELIARGVSPPDTQLVQDDIERDANNTGIEDNPAEGLFVLCPADLWEREKARERGRERREREREREGN